MSTEIYSYVLTRAITQDEVSRLPRDLGAGERVLKFHGFTYGVIDDWIEVACEVEDLVGFIGLPKDALEVLETEEIS